MKQVEAFALAEPAALAKNAHEIVLLADFPSRMPCEDVPWLLDKAFTASSGDVVVFATHDGEATVNADEWKAWVKDGKTEEVASLSDDECWPPRE